MLKKVLIFPSSLKKRWAGTSFSGIIRELNSYLESERKRKEALQNLLLSGRISRNTFDLMEKKISRISSVISEFKETLEAEDPFWKADLSEETRILETLLIELELKRLLGEIGEKEYSRKSEIIKLGLDSFRNRRTLTDRNISKPDPPIQTVFEEDGSKKIMNRSETEGKREISQMLSMKDRDIEPAEEENPVRDRHFLDKPRRRATKELPEIENPLASEMRCMNPWKPECRNTDIELSIYYDGRMIPICRRCWENISKENVEWSSL